MARPQSAWEALRFRMAAAGALAVSGTVAVIAAGTGKAAEIAGSGVLPDSWIATVTAVCGTVTVGTGVLLGLKVRRDLINTTAPGL